MTRTMTLVVPTLLVVTVLAVSVKAQTWQEIYNPSVDLEAFVVAPATLMPSGPSGFAAFDENTMACAHMRTYQDSSSGKWSREVIVLRSTNGGDGWTLIGEFKDWPWSTTNAEPYFNNISFAPNGSVFIKSGPHILVWDEGSGEWTEQWDAVATAHANFPVYAVEATGDVLVLRSGQQAYRLEADGETFRQFDGVVAVTPDSTLLVQKTRLQMFKANAPHPHVAYKNFLPFDQGVMYSPVTDLLTNVHYVCADGGQTWQALPSEPDLTAFENGIAVARNGVCYASRNETSLFVSSNYGRSWLPADKTGLVGKISAVRRSLDGRQAIVVSTIGTAFLATDSALPLEQLWPPDADTSQPMTTRLVAPGVVNVGVDFEYSTDSTFSTNVNRASSSTRYNVVNGLNEYTAYYWRYRDAPTGAPKGTWSTVHSFRTTTASFWRCVMFGGDSPASNWIGGATIDGTLYAARIGDTLLFHSTDRGLTFDTLTSLPDQIASFYETPRGVLHVRAGSWYRVEPSGSVSQVGGRPIAHIATTSFGHMFASSNDTLVLSKDDGLTWSKGRHFYEKITGMVVDGDDKLWIGAGYWANMDPFNGTKMVGGLRTMNTITGAFTQVAPTNLQPGHSEVRNYHSLCRQPDGTMYAYDTYGPFITSPASGKPWTAVLNATGNPNVNALCLDADGSAIVLPVDRKYVVRQEDSTSWRPLVAGLFPIGQQVPYTDNFKRVSQDGTIMAFGEGGVWILENPSRAAGIAPHDRDTLVNTNGVNFSWPATTDATRYLLQVSDAPQFKQLNTGDTAASLRALEVNTETLSPIYTMDRTLPSGRYFWRTASLVNGAWQYAASIHTFVVSGPVKVEDHHSVNVPSEFLFGISPHPATDAVTITSAQPIDHVQLFSVDGQLAREQQCAQETTVTINVGHCTPGLYIVRASSQGKIAQHVMVVVH